MGAAIPSMERGAMPVSRFEPSECSGNLTRTWHVHENLVFPWESQRKRAEQCKPDRALERRGSPEKRAINTGATGSLVNEMLVVFLN